MAAKLNKYFIMLILLAVGISGKAQSFVVTDYPDYKNSAQHKKFARRNNKIAEWQINKLKEGALIVRLKTDAMTVNALKQQGNYKLAEKRELELYAINKTVVISFKDYYTFSKVYFIYSNYSDSLFKGKRTNMFLDTNLQIDKNIIMKEDYYLIADKDFLYNSSIGFVKEDTAKFVKESGNPERHKAFVLKNKYGHQLHNPFPFYIGYYTNYGKTIVGKRFDFPIGIFKTTNQKDSISFVVNKNYVTEQTEITKGVRKAVILRQNETIRIVEIEKDYLYERISLSVENLNDNLILFHKNSRMPLDEDLNDPLIKPYLY